MIYKNCLKFLSNIKPINYLLGVFIVVLFYSFLCNEILPIEYVSLFDEKSYIDIVQNFSSHLSEQNFVAYYNSRILIPSFAHYVLSILNLETHIETIRNVFLYFNLASIFLALYYCYKIAKFKKYENGTIALGLCFLFTNFFILKFSNFYPVLMDVFGFTSGIIIYYYYLIKKKTLLFITLLLSLFLFPTTVFIILSLSLSTLVVFNEKGINFKKHLKSYRFLFTAIVLLTLVAYAYLLIQQNSQRSTQFEPQIVPLTIILLSIFIFYLLKHILFLFNKISFNVKFYKSTFFFIPLLLLIVSTLISKGLSLHYTGPPMLTPLTFISNLLYQAISFPLKFLISHFIYYGAFVIILLLFSKQFFVHVSKSPPFEKIVILLFILLSIGTETRQFIQLFPFVVFLFLDSINKYKLNSKFIVTVFLFQLIWSRFWYSINTPEGFLSNAIPGNNFMEFPAQRYFQFQGPWLSTNNSIIYGCIFSITYLVTWTLVKKMNKRKMITHKD